MLFNWVRNKVRAAVLAGVEDALTDLEAGAPTEATDAAAARLRARLQPAALPGPVLDNDAIPDGNRHPVTKRGRRSAD